jgi:hypothetical protein
LARKNSNEHIGPATYDTEGRAHKELMQALYPKKKAPFNKTEIRESPLLQPQNMRNLPGKSQTLHRIFIILFGIGPGHYSVDREISNSMSAYKSFPMEYGTYIINDNGHMN